MPTPAILDNTAPFPGLGNLQERRRRILELPNLIHFIDAYEAPFLAFLNFAARQKEETPDYRFRIQEKRPIADVGYLLAVANNFNAPTLGQATGVTLDLDTPAAAADHSWLWNRQVLQFETSGQTAVVTDILNGDAGTLELQSVDPTSPNVAIVPGERVISLGTAYQDGSNIGRAIHRATTGDYNHTQIFRYPVKVSRRTSTADLHGGQKITEMERDAIRNAKRGMERAFLLGKRYTDGTIQGEAGTQNHETSLTEGAITWWERRAATENLAIQYTGALNALQYDALITIMEYASRWKSSNLKYFFVGRAAMSRFNTMAFMNYQQRYEFKESKSPLGLVYSDIVSNYMTLRLIECPTFDLNGAYANHGFIADPACFRYRYFRGWDAQWKPIEQDNGEATEYRKEFYVDCGLEARMPELCTEVRFTAEPA